MKIKNVKMAFSRCNDKYKKEINNLLARYGRRDKISIVLDGAKAETSKTLIRNGFKGNTIHIPNPTKDYKFLRKLYNKESQPKLYETWLNKLFSLFNRETIGLAYLDYMCTLEGNDKCKPVDDIINLFNRRLLCDGACLAITISVHDGRLKKSLFKHSELLRLLNVVTTTSLKNGYTTEILTGAGLYRSTMWTIIFKVYKNDPALIGIYID
jgi:hypothetical protein